MNMNSFFTLLNYLTILHLFYAKRLLTDAHINMHVHPTMVAKINQTIIFLFH